MLGTILLGTPLLAMGEMAEFSISPKIWSFFATVAVAAILLWVLEAAPVARKAGPIILRWIMILLMAIIALWLVSTPAAQNIRGREMQEKGKTEPPSGVPHFY